MAGEFRSSNEKRLQWQKAVEGQSLSGLSISRFCREQGLNKSQFYYWKRRLGGWQEDSKSSKKSSFIPVAVTGDLLSSGVTIRLPNGIVIEIQGRA